MTSILTDGEQGSVRQVEAAYLAVLVFAFVVIAAGSVFVVAKLLRGSQRTSRR